MPIDMTYARMVTDKYTGSIGAVYQYVKPGQTFSTEMVHDLIPLNAKDERAVVIVTKPKRHHKAGDYVIWDVPKRDA